MTHTEPGCNEVVNQPNASRLHRDVRLGGTVIVLGHAEEHGPETGRLVQLGADGNQFVVAGKWGMGNR